jgi:hypothetical protein
MRGDAVLYVWDHIDIDDALGYHDKNDRGIPFGFVFLDLATDLEEPWTVTLSHEALELIGDPETNLFAVGPHPKDRRRHVFHWYEMCDAVQDERYLIFASGLASVIRVRGVRPSIGYDGRRGAAHGLARTKPSRTQGAGMKQLCPVNS